MKERQLSPTQKITFAAMLLALSVIMTFIAKTIPMGAFYYLRFSLTPSLIIYTSLTLGPLYGAIVGLFSDLLPALAYPQGSYNFLISIVYILLGVLPWCLAKLTKRFRSALHKPYAFYVALAIIFIIICSLFYGTELLDESFGANAVWAKPTILAVVFVLDIGLCVGLYFTNKYYQKRILENPDVPSPNETALIALVSEVVLMDVLKALAFFLWYNFLANETFPLSYWFVFSMLIMGSPVNILIIVFADSWMLIFTKRFIHAYGWASDKPGKKSKEEKKETKEIVLEESDDYDEKIEKRRRISWIIFFTVLILAMVACILVIKLI